MTLLNCLYDYIKDEGGFWGSLIAGLLALAAGVLAYRAGNIQAAATREAAIVQGKQEEARIQRRHRAARAVLPLALSSTVEYAHKCALWLERARIQFAGPTPRESLPPTPTFDANAIRAMQDVIENGTVEVGDRIADIISATQILKANVDAVGELSLPAGVAPRVEDIRFYIARAAEIYARGSAMFSFARNESEDPPPRHPTPQDMTVALNLMGFPDFNYPDLHTLAVNKATSWD